MECKPETVISVRMAARCKKLKAHVQDAAMKILDEHLMQCLSEEEVLPCDLGPPRALPWSRLLARPTSVDHYAGAFPWTDLNIRKVDESLIPSIERLYADVGWQAHGRLPDVHFFGALASSKEFQRLWAGDSRGPFILPMPCVKDLLTLDDVLHGLSASSATRKPCESALTLTDGADFRCPISLPPIRSKQDLLQVLEYGTIFLNTASLHWKVAAELCLNASRALHFPSNINVYVTGRDRKVSTDCHTDNHDVLIFHTQGAKRWRIYAPPPLSEKNPLYRGKDEDRLLDSELGECLLDLVLQPGELLFVPMGFPHATSTEATEEVSIHLTLGLSTADYDFCLGGLRRCLLAELQSPREAKAALWELLRPLRVGALAPTEDLPCDIGRELLELLLKLGDVSQGELEELRPHAEDLVCRLLTRQVAVLKSQEEAYEEVIRSSDGIFFKATPEETRSEYRRTMLRHQIEEDERKRCVENAADPRFVRRLDPLDGVARTFAELQRLHNLSVSDTEAYWEACQSLYPGDQPPAALIDELQRASERCGDLLHFLRKRTPHLHSESLHGEPVPRTLAQMASLLRV